MMRYQRMIPDYNPLRSGSKSSFRDGENGGGFRFRSSSKPLPPSPEFNDNHSNNYTTTFASSPLSDDNNNNSNHINSNGGRGGDVLLQWGNKKRARLSRTEIRLLTDDSSSSSSIHRRGGGSSFVDKASPPPPLLPTATRASNLRTQESFGFINNRNIEDPSGTANGSPSRNLAGGNTQGVPRSAASKWSPRSSEKIDKNKLKEEKTANGSLAARLDSVCTRVETEQQEAQAGVVDATAAATTTTTTTNRGVSMAEKVNNVEMIKWPRIYIALSRKEKEDDFLAMKGTKLPHRPKKRAKNISRTLQYCFPGMWLSDLTKSRYEVREKKSVKKKRRGLKGMENMETDSD